MAVVASLRGSGRIIPASVTTGERRKLKPSRRAAPAPGPPRVAARHLPGAPLHPAPRLERQSGRRARSSRAATAGLALLPAALAWVGKLIVDGVVEAAAAGAPAPRRTPPATPRRTPPATSPGWSPSSSASWWPSSASPASPATGGAPPGQPRQRRSRSRILRRPSSSSSATSRTARPTTRCRTPGGRPPRAPSPWPCSSSPSARAWSPWPPSPACSGASRPTRCSWWPPPRSRPSWPRRASPASPSSSTPGGRRRGGGSTTSSGS